ncbi:hypothetical protein [Chitinivorax sp. B]|uniref:hypothetical protein n=1 Tax=Chitinivorax sp. B TaxID=2502235 RepID=UPI0010F9E033|nr:hypothetical protein [Chitinivorax sp. B]
MNTHILIAQRHLFKVLSGTLFVACVSQAAMALPSDASGSLDMNGNGLPRLTTDTCYASYNGSINAMGQSNFPVAFRLFRDGIPVTADSAATWFQANNSTIAFQPGNYQMIAVNKMPTRPARITMSLTCS